MEALAARFLRVMWAHYVRIRSVDDCGYALELRNCLIEYYAEHGPIRSIAHGLCRRLPRQVQPDELISAGLEGMIRAMGRFNPARGASFETFSQQAIRGAMIDWLRGMDPLPRQARARASRLESARDELRSRMGGEPSDEALCVHLRISGEELSRMKASNRRGLTISLARPRRTSAGSRVQQEQDVLPDLRSPSPHHSAERRDLRRWLTTGLSRAERLIVILYYYENLSMAEIGLVLDLGEARISQIHASILARLRVRLERQPAHEALAHE